MIRMKRLLVLGLSIVLGLSGCQTVKEEKPVPESQQDEKEEKPYQSNLNVIKPSAYRSVKGLYVEPGTSISMIGRGESSDYWKNVEAGAKQAISDINELLGYSGGDKLVLNYAAPENYDGVDEQVNILDEELDRYPGALAIAAADSQACEVQFDLACQNGIPIVAFDAGVHYQDIASMIDTDNHSAAAMAANKLAALIGDEGKILVIVHDSISTSAENRESGFVKQIEDKYPGIETLVYHLDDFKDKRLEMAEELLAGEELQAEEEKAEEAKDEESKEESEEETEKSEESEEMDRENLLKEKAESLSEKAVLTWILDKEEITGVFATNENCVELLEKCLDDAQKQEIKIVSFDGGKAQRERLKNGTVDGLIIQNPFGMGYATIIACVRACAQEANEAVVDTGFAWVTEENIDDASIAQFIY